MMLQVWDGKDPLIPGDLPEFVDLYIGWCRKKGGARAKTPVEDWKADALHTRRFFDELVNRRRQPRNKTTREIIAGRSFSGSRQGAT